MEKLIKKGLKTLKVIAPIVLAGAFAVIQAIGEQKDQKRIDTMEMRINQLETQKKES